MPLAGVRRPRHSRLHARRCPACAALALSLTLPGCTRALLSRALQNETLDEERTRQIEPMDLTEHSRSEPVTVDQASEDLVEQYRQRPEPPETLDLTLPDVRATALANNLDLHVQLVEPAIAQATVDEEEARFEMTFNGSVRRSRSDAPTSLGTQGTKSTFDQYSFGIDMPLITGGAGSITLPFTRASTNNPFSLLDPAYDVDLRFAISQPILRNAGVAIATQSIRVARRQSQIADARTKLQAIRVLAGADRAYWQVYAARGELDVRRKQYEVAMEQLERARRKFQAGDVPEIEITRAQSAAAGSLEAIIVSETAVRSRERDLKRIMNRPDLPITSPTALLPGTAPEPLGLELDAGALITYALEHRMEMLELELQLLIDALNIDLQRNATLPLVNVDYSYTINGLAGTLGEAFDQLPDRSFEDWSVGVNVEVPLGNEAAEARLRRAVLLRLQRLATKEQRRLEIEQSVLEALDQLQQSWQRILAARQEAILAGATYDAERRQFQVGLRTSTEVDDALSRLADAQSREVRVIADHQIAQIGLAEATGTLLGRDRVRWNPVEAPQE